MNFYGRNLIKRWTFVLAFVLGVVGIVTLQRSRLHNIHDPSNLATYQRQSQQEKLKLDFFRNLPSLGFNNLFADWIYLRFIQYYGNSPARDAIGYELVPDYFREIVQRDPRFVDAMPTLAIANSIFAGEPHQSVQYLNQSLQHIAPEQTVFTHQPYFIWIYKGRDEFLFLGDAQAAIKSYNMAIHWAKALNTRRSLQSVKNLTATNQSLRQNPHSKFAQIGAWALVLSSNLDPKTQQRAIAEINALGGIVTQTEEGRFLVKVPEGVE